MPVSHLELRDRFTAIWLERMQGLPFVSPSLEVEPVSFRPVGEHEIGVLITPWFMNLVLLPGSGEFDERRSGDVVGWRLPHGRYELTVNRDEELGTFLTAVLFRGVTGIPDQDFARAVAEEIMRSLFEEPAPQARKTIDRRALLTGMRRTG